MTSPYKSNPNQEAEPAKLHWVAPRPLVILACLLLFSVFLQLLPPPLILSLQRRWWRDLRPVRRRQRRGLHGEGRDPAGQADPERRGLPAPDQRGAPGPEGERAESPTSRSHCALSGRLGEGVHSFLSSVFPFFHGTTTPSVPS